MLRAARAAAASALALFVLCMPALAQSPEGTDEVRRRAEELSQAASKRFGEVLKGETADAAPAPRSGPTPSPVARDSLVTVLQYWLDWSEHEYQGIVRRLALEGSGSGGLVPGWLARAGRDIAGFVRRLADAAASVLRPGDAEKQLAERSATPAEMLWPTPMDAAPADEPTAMQDASRAEAVRMMAEAKARAEADAKHIADRNKRDAPAHAKVKPGGETGVAVAGAAPPEGRADAHTADERAMAAGAKKLAQLRAQAEADARRVAEMMQAAKAEGSAMPAARPPSGPAMADRVKPAEAEPLTAQVDIAPKASSPAAKSSETAVPKIQEAAVAKPAEPAGAPGIRREEAPKTAAKTDTPATDRSATGSVTGGALTTATAAATAVRPVEGAVKSDRGTRRASKIAGSRRRTAERPHSRRGTAGTCRAAGAKARLPGWYVVRKGDTLWRIAERHYGSGKRYKRIAAANRARLRRGADWIVPCQRLYLPGPVRRHA
jgi:nucleoid-associated protein YgaU